MEIILENIGGMKLILDSVKQNFTQEMNNIIGKKHDVSVDRKYQNITYYMHSKEKTVKEKLIDFPTAINEMLSLDWNYSPNYIGFTNSDTKENVQFSCVGVDKWYAEILIKNNGKWEGYVYCCYSKFEPIENMLSLFFEELEWNNILSWNLKRIGKYAKY